MLKINWLFRLNVWLFKLFGWLSNLKKWPQYRKNRPLFARNKQLKERKTSQRCYICGNGPSLRSVNWQELKGDTIVVNDFFRYGAQLGPNIQPTYYMMVDNSYLEEKFRHRLEMAISIYRETNYVFSDDFVSYLTETRPRQGNHYFFYLARNLFQSQTAAIDYTQRVMGCQNVVGNAITLALYLGYEEIILVGCDFNLFATVNLEHCYADDDGGERINLANMLFRYSFVTAVHYQLALYARQVKVRIINATQGSLLDAYPLQRNYGERQQE